MRIHNGSPISMRSKIIEARKSTLKLSNIQREVLIGTLLGDGCLETQNNSRTYRLKIEHSLLQKEYVDWKYGIFKDWVLTEPKVREYVAYGLLRKNYRFSTVSHGALRFYAQQFYRNGEKIIPQTIHKWLSPLALAVWFMDDGSIKSNQHRALVIHAQSFKEGDLRRIILILEKKYGIESVLRKRNDGNGFVIYLTAHTIQRFIATVENFILPSMKYKLGNTIAQKVTEAYKGQLAPDGNRGDSANA